MINTDDTKTNTDKELEILIKKQAKALAKNKATKLHAIVSYVFLLPIVPLLLFAVPSLKEVVSSRGVPLPALTIFVFTLARYWYIPAILLIAYGLLIHKIWDPEKLNRLKAITLLNLLFGIIFMVGIFIGLFLPMGGRMMEAIP